MNTIRIRTGRWSALILILTAAFLAGCNRVSPEVAKARFDQGIKLEQAGDKNGALEAYQAAANGRFEEQAQALANMGRLATELKKSQVAVQAYTLLARQHSDATVNAAAPGEPADEQVVREWIGTAARHDPEGPLYAVEREQDEINSAKIWYKMMDAIVAATGRNPWYSYAFALFVFTAVVKFLMTPLTKQQFHSMRKMTAIQPKMKELQEKLKDRPEEMNRAVMQLYKTEGVNPVGCAGGMILQFPILIGLYSLIGMYKFQFKEGYFLWVNPTTHQLAPGIIGSNLAQPDIILLVLYAISMYLSQKLTVVPSQDPQQKQQQMMMAYMMPIMFLFVLKDFPSAFILYWLMFNVLTTWQQWHLMKVHPLETAPVPAAGPSDADAYRPSQGQTGDPAPSRKGGPGPSRTPSKRKKR